MPYVDGFVLAVPKARMAEYEATARLGATVWKDHGALSYVECLAEDVPHGEITSFPRAVQAREDETIILSWITYESRAARDAVMARVMADPRMKDAMANPPFDGKRMILGGFTTLVEA